MKHAEHQGCGSTAGCCGNEQTDQVENRQIDNCCHNNATDSQKIVCAELQGTREGTLNQCKQ